MQQNCSNFWLSRDSRWLAELLRPINTLLVFTGRRPGRYTPGPGSRGSSPRRSTLPCPELTRPIFMGQVNKAVRLRSAYEPSASNHYSYFDIAFLALYIDAYVVSMARQG
jgi:hypothetical protein